MTDPAATSSVPPAGPLAGKVAVVTGASRGIGRAIAIALAEAGAQVAGCALAAADDAAGRGQGFLDDLATPERRNSFLTACDVRSSQAVAAFRDEVLARLGAPDILVNNAGIVVRAALVDLAESDWNDVVSSNLTGTFLVTRAFLGGPGGMIERRLGGRIINIASIAGRQGTAMLAAYCAAKHGVVGLTRSCAEELREHHIVVNAICPGSVDTDMLKIGMPGGTPKMGPADIARTALFLAAQAPLALTGACIDVFG
jgi:NAD(P)-dependent dehydrogenase (short-subunit alcohol dehydrogenase family)